MPRASPPATAPSAWLELSREDFLSALRRLKPRRMLKSLLSKELQIAFIEGEAVFCVEGAQTRRPAQGQWSGFACLAFGQIYPFLKIQPQGRTVRITLEGGCVCIETMRLKARWTAASK